MEIVAGLTDSHVPRSGQPGDRLVEDACGVLAFDRAEVVAPSLCHNCADIHRSWRGVGCAGDAQFLYTGAARSTERCHEALPVVRAMIPAPATARRFASRVPDVSPQSS